LKRNRNTRNEVGRAAGVPLLPILADSRGPDVCERVENL
jgi:hypothetical protein